MYMKTEEFIKEAKRSILFANILPEDVNRAYANPLFLQYSMTTIMYNLKCNIIYNDHGMSIWDYFHKELYMTIDFSELQEVMVGACERIMGIPQTQQHVELYVKTRHVDMRIETKDCDHVLVMLHKIHKQGIEIQDPYEILKILLKTRKEKNGYYDYMLEHYHDIARKYDLDLPRISVYRKDAKGLK